VRLFLLGLLLTVPQERTGWNQLEEALRPPRQKKIEITNWPIQVPLAELSSPEAPALLDKFAARPADLGLVGPIQQALAQRLLWAFFDEQVRSWKYVDPDRKPNQPVVPGPPKQKKPEAALRPAAQLIRRLALSEAEIRALPDPYARTVESKMYPTDFDSGKPTEPFLPPNLWDPEGPWISLGNSVEMPLAVRHTRYFGGRSSFQIFLRVPEGRQAGLDLVRSLSTYRGQKQYDPPKIPAGMIVVLVEQPILINAASALVPSPLVESVEMRVIHKPEKRFSNTKSEIQSVFRFRLRPDLLLANDPAPLRARGFDEADWEPVSLLVEQGRVGGFPTRGTSIGHCANCHSFTQAQTLGIFEMRFGDAGLLEIVVPAKERERILKWKEKDETWKELQSYWK
jgi:hypothetical protein